MHLVDEGIKLVACGGCLIIRQLVSYLIELVDQRTALVLSQRTQVDQVLHLCNCRRDRLEDKRSNSYRYRGAEPGQRSGYRMSSGVDDRNSVTKNIRHIDYAPLGCAATPPGKSPTGTVATTVLVAVSITETLSDDSLAT